MSGTSSTTSLYPLPDDAGDLRRFGYPPQLVRGFGGFSSYALSLSGACVLAGGLTAFHVGFGAIGGAAIGLGWPVLCLLALALAATLGQLASAFPTAGGVYHWAAYLGGRGWGWATAWLNLLGHVALLATVNLGTFQFARAGFFPDSNPDDPTVLPLQYLIVALFTASQAVINHLGIRVVRLFIDFSGWWIVGVAVTLTVALLASTSLFVPSRLIEFANFSGLPTTAPTWPRQESLTWLFGLGLLLPAFTLVGFGASTNTAEETTDPRRAVPRGLVRSVLVSGIVGWITLAAIVAAMPAADEPATAGSRIIMATLTATLSKPFVVLLLGGAVVAQYLCGLAILTAASRLAFAFARDGGLPRPVRWVSPRFKTPAVAIWSVALIAAVLATAPTVAPMLHAVGLVLLLVSYAIPTALGFIAHELWWKTFGPWQLGRWFRPLACISFVACVGLMILGMWPPHEASAVVVAGVILAIFVSWFAWARRGFRGPPPLLDD